MVYESYSSFAGTSIQAPGKGIKGEREGRVLSRAQPRKLYTTIFTHTIWPGLSDMSSHSYKEVGKSLAVRTSKSGGSITNTR